MIHSVPLVTLVTLISTFLRFLGGPTKIFEYCCLGARYVRMDYVHLRGVEFIQWVQQFRVSVVDSEFGTEITLNTLFEV